MDLIFMNSALEDIGVLMEYDLDLAFGADENDFECQILSSAHCCQPGWYLYIEGTEYGGIIDSIEVDTGGGNLTYKGRTWHGMLDSKVLEPDSGEAYLKVSGEANSILASLLSRIGLSGLFVASSEPSGININNYQMNRYVTAYSGITKMLNSVDAKLRLIFSGGKVVLSAVTKQKADQDDEIDSDQIDFVMEKNYRTVNHLVCLGKGELTERTVIHLFADAEGNISQTQTFFGVDEYMQVFDYPSAETDEELINSGTERLKELQATSEVSVDCDETADTFDVGDVVSAYDNVTGMSVSAVIEKKVVSVVNGKITIILTPGTNKSSSSGSSGNSGNSGSGGSSGSSDNNSNSPSWKIGEGLLLTDDVLSVDTADSVEENNKKPVTSSATYEAIKSAKVRPNLLDNWYFANPVNQRGQTSYTAQWSYCLDRWLAPGIVHPVTIGNQYVSFDVLDQFISEVLPDGLYTASILLSNGSLYTGTAYYSAGLGIGVVGSNGVVDVYLMGDATSEGGNPRLRIQAVSGEPINFVAAKLELGDTQTLAHQDASGNWVLNEIPNYGEQLARCQRYYVAVSSYFGASGYLTSSAKSYHMYIYTPVPMRTLPTVAMDSYIARKHDGYSVHTGSSYVAPKSLVVAPGGSNINGCFLDIYDTVTSAVDTNNIVLSYAIKNLTLSADL